jgi:hypothetical protein
MGSTLTLYNSIKEVKIDDIAHRSIAGGIGMQVVPKPTRRVQISIRSTISLF